MILFVEQFENCETCKGIARTTISSRFGSPPNETIRGRRKLHDLLKLKREEGERVERQA